MSVTSNRCNLLSAVERQVFLTLFLQEALIRKPNLDQDCRLQVDYDIVLSPTYQVPTLFFIFPAICQVGSNAIDAAYRYLVPHQYGSSLKNVGVMGGLSFGVREPPLVKSSPTISELTMDSIIQSPACLPTSSIPVTLRTPCATSWATETSIPKTICSYGLD
jgi:hypothetical protein